MLNMTNYSISANSEIDGMVVAYLSANYSANNTSYNMSVNDRKLYELNKVTVDSDYEEFKMKADDFAKNIVTKEE